MKLNDLLNGVEGAQIMTWGEGSGLRERGVEDWMKLSQSSQSEIEVSGLAYYSRRVEPGNVFFALPGQRQDGARFVHEAVERSAVAVVADQMIDASGVPLIVVPNAREAMAVMAANFYDHPSRSLKVIGITGTNGKTTTAFLCRHILDATLQRCGLVGTVKYIVGDEEIEAPHTTPEAPDLQRLLAQMRDAGDRCVAMEVSSHALHQARTDAVAFDTAVFTNLTQDHLDYHITMDAYFEAKEKLFDMLVDNGKKKTFAVINVDDRYGRILADRIAKGVKVLTYGRAAKCDFRAGDVRFDLHGTQFRLTARGRDYLVRLPFIGAFNVSNALAALAATASLGIEIRAAVAALARAPQVPGRLQRIPAKRHFHVFVDYAHTDDALRNALTTLRELNPARIITVVGCGGDRDKTKRPLMAAAATELSDYCIFTSDNPRSEAPAAILADMRAGARGARFEKIPDSPARGDMSVVRGLHLGENPKEEEQNSVGMARENIRGTCFGEVIERSASGKRTANVNTETRGFRFEEILDRTEAITRAIALAGEGDIILIAGKGHETYQEINGERTPFDDAEVAAAAIAARPVEIIIEEEKPRFERPEFPPYEPPKLEEGVQE